MNFTQKLPTRYRYKHMRRKIYRYKYYLIPDDSFCPNFDSFFTNYDIKIRCRQQVYGKDTVIECMYVVRITSIAVHL